MLTPKTLGAVFDKREMYRQNDDVNSYESIF